MGDIVLDLNESITLSWKNLCVSVPASKGWSLCDLLSRSLSGRPAKKILKNAHGVAAAGQLLAIMGPSGAGKSTLLNALTFKNLEGLEVTGSRTANGELVTPDSLTARSAYVQQEEIFVGTLTVMEHLIFQALVRMDKDIPEEERMMRIDEVVKETGLGNVVDTTIGIPGVVQGISGGERKRVALASEFLTNPSIMFCDEPKSGLDSFMATNVVDTLKLMAEMGKTVILTIHQPSSQIYTSFDKILLVAEGQTAFLGSPRAALSLFERCGFPCPQNFNPADHFMEVLAKVPGDVEKSQLRIATICRHYNESPHQIEDQSEVINLEKISPYKASWGTQFKALLWRNYVSAIKLPPIIKVVFIQNVVMALILGTIFSGQQLDQDGISNMNGCLFNFLAHVTFSNWPLVIILFCKELNIFRREHFNGMYRIDTYFLAKQLADTPVFLVNPIVFVSIMYFMVGLNPQVDKFFICCGILVLTVQVVLSFGYLLSSLSSSEEVAQAVMPVVIVPLVLLGGFYLVNNSLPAWLDWLKYLSWFHFANSALLVNQWTGIHDIACAANSTVPCLTTGEQVLLKAGTASDPIWFNVLMLAALAIGYRILAFLALYVKTSRLICNKS